MDTVELLIKEDVCHCKKSMQILENIDSPFNWSIVTDNTHMLEIFLEFAPSLEICKQMNLVVSLKICEVVIQERCS